MHNHLPCMHRPYLHIKYFRGEKFDQVKSLSYRTQNTISKVESDGVLSFNWRRLAAAIDCKYFWVDRMEEHQRRILNRLLHRKWWYIVFLAYILMYIRYIALNLFYIYEAISAAWSILQRSIALKFSRLTKISLQWPDHQLSHAMPTMHCQLINTGPIFIVGRCFVTTPVDVVLISRHRVLL